MNFSSNMFNVALCYVSNLVIEINSPLDQFEIRDILNLEILGGNFHLSLTNIGFYLLIGGTIILTSGLLATNYNKLVSIIDLLLKNLYMLLYIT